MEIKRSEEDTTRKRRRNGAVYVVSVKTEFTELSQLAESWAEVAGEAETGKTKLPDTAGEAENAVPVAWSGG